MFAVISAVAMGVSVVRAKETRLPREWVTVDTPRPRTHLARVTDTINDMIDDFAFLDTWEDRYMHVIDLGKGLEPLSDDERSEANKVRGCASQVWLVGGRDGERLRYRGDSDAHIVRGLVAVTLAALSGRTPQEILDTDMEALLGKLGLAEHLSAQRANGLRSMVARIRGDAIAALA